MNLARRGTILAVAILLFGAVAQWLPAGLLPAGAWRWPAALWLLLLAVEGLLSQVQGIGAALEPSPPLRLGRGSRIHARLANGAARALELDVFWPVPAGAGGAAARARLRLAGGGNAALVLDLVPLRLGTLAPSPVLARSLGRFGLAWWSRRMIPAGALPPVAPDLLGLPRAQAGGAALGGAPMQRRGAGLELLGLREYQPGDPLRSIAWKAAAHSGRLLVREVVEDQHLDLLLVLDAGRAGAQLFGELSRLHHCVNVAARLAERAAALGDRVGLVAYAGAVCARVPLSGGLSGVRAVRRALSGLLARNEESDPLAAAFVVQRECRVRALTVWFTDAESGTHGGALPQAVRRLAPKHLPLIASLRDPQLQGLAQQRPLQWNDPYVALAATHALERAARSAADLRRLGCEVVEAPPERLDAAVVQRYLELRGRHRV